MSDHAYVGDHVYVAIHSRYANPYLVCDRCGRRVVGCVDVCNLPCGHRADMHSVCPSWSPVDGCRCWAHLGYVPHGAPGSTADP